MVSSLSKIYLSYFRNNKDYKHERTNVELQLYNFSVHGTCEQPLLAPVGVTLRGHVLAASSTSSPASCFTLVKVDVDPLSLYACPLQLNDLTTLAKRLERSFKNIMPVKENIVNESSTECSGTEEKLTVNNTPVDISREDLRDGLMTYLEVSDEKDIIRKDNLTYFCSSATKSTLTWFYSEPRNIQLLSIQAMPFILNNEDCKVDCDLSYWSVLHSCYFHVRDFTIVECTESVVISADLPIAAVGWRISIFNDQTYEPMILPQTLLASASVTSCYDEHLIPSLQSVVVCDDVKVTFANHPKQSSVSPMSEFLLEKEPCTGVLALNLSKLNIKTIITDNTLVEVNTAIEVSTMDYGHLRWVQMLHPTKVHAKLDLSRSATNKRHLSIKSSIDDIDLEVSDSAVHTLAYLRYSFDETETLANDAHYYILCNNTERLLYFQQRNSNYTLSLKPGRCKGFSWISCNKEHIIHVSVNDSFVSNGENIDPISLDTIGGCSFNSCGTILYADVQMRNSMQKTVTISGLVTIVTCIHESLEFKLTTVDAKSEKADVSQIKTAYSDNVLTPSLVTSQPIDNNYCLQLLLKKEADWSLGVMISGPDKIHKPKIIKISGSESKDSLYVWCEVFTERILNDYFRILVVISPLFVIRCYMPTSLSMTVQCDDQSKSSKRQHIKLIGRGRESQISIASPQRNHKLSFSKNEHDKVTCTSMSISSTTIDGISHQPCSKNTKSIDSMIFELVENNNTSNDELLSPYSNNNHNTETIDYENEISLKLTLEPYGKGLRRTLLITVSPSWLVVNSTSLRTLSVVADGQRWQLPSEGEAVALPNFTSKFTLCIEEQNSLFYSKAYELSDQTGVFSNGQQMPNITGLLYQKVQQEVKILMQEKKSGRITICLLTIESCIVNYMRVIRISERWRLFNGHRQTLLVKCLMIPMEENSKALSESKDLFADQHTMSLPGSLRTDWSEYTSLIFWNLHCSSTDLLCRLTEQYHDFVFTYHLVFAECSEGNIVYSRPCQLQPASSDLDLYRHNLTLSPNITLAVTSYEYCEGSNSNRYGISIYLCKEERIDVRIINHSNMVLHYGESLESPTDDSLVYEELNLLKYLPTISPYNSHLYNLPSKNINFPNSGETKTRKLKRIRFAVCPSPWKRSEVHCCPGVHWSFSLDISTLEHLSFLKLPNACDVKIHTEISEQCLLLHVHPISRAEISAKVIRSRLRANCPEKITIIENTSFKESSKLEDTKETRYRMSEDIEDKDIKIQNYTKNDTQGLELTVALDFSRISVVAVVSELHHQHRFLAFTALDIAVTRNSHQTEALVEYCLSVGSMQADNLIHNESYDYPVVFSASRSAQHPQALSAKLITQYDLEIVDLDIQLSPFVLEIEDSFIYAVIDRISRFSSNTLTKKEKSNIDYTFDRAAMTSIVHPYRCSKVTIHPLSIVISVHASAKVYVAFDNTPMNFSAFQRYDLFTSPAKLTRTVSMHYITSVLARTGLIVGSLDILGSPMGLIRDISAGFSDLVSLPLHGATIGPKAFVSGISGGLTSLMRHVSSGTLTSISNFASSLARNMDRITLDPDYQTQQEYYQRPRPDGITDGVKNGVASFALSLLGAIAGIANQPLQAITNPSTRVDEADTKLRQATSVALGVGRGLVGVITKPIGGAAGLLSQTTLGLLAGSGLSVLAQTKVKYQRTSFNDMCPSNIYFQRILKRNDEDMINIVMKSFVHKIQLSAELIQGTIIITKKELIFVTADDDKRIQLNDIQSVTIETSQTPNKDSTSNTTDTTNDIFNLYCKKCIITLKDHIKTEVESTRKCVNFLDMTTSEVVTRMTITDDTYAMLKNDATLLCNILLSHRNNHFTDT